MRYFFHHRILFLLPLLFASSFSISQQYTLSGKISGNNESLPFASIYIKGTTKGVTSNDEGAYSMKLEKGNYILVFQYIGFSKQEIKVDLNENRVLNIDLKLDGISLKEITVLAGEDPAYPIMRQAIKKRSYFSEEVKTYSCQTYVKGLQRLVSIPEKFKKLIKFTSGEKVDSSLFGIIYLSESESDYYYKHPNKQKEIMYSSRVSGESQSFSFNQYNQLKFDFYQNLIDIMGIAERPLVSPLNNNAFLFYKFKLLGTYSEEGKLFNKIEVKAKRNTDPCFNGIIYIQENTWRLTGVDLKLTKAQKIKFVDTVNIKQLFSPLENDSVWMPVNHNFSFSFRFLGIVGDGYFNATAKNFNLNPNLAESFFSNELLVVKDDANKKDSAYWKQNRPTPLTHEEEKDYRKKDSVEKIQNTDRYKDSVDKKSNQFRVADALLGYTFTNTRKGITMNIPGIVSNGVQYNTVEGVNLIYNFTLTKNYDDERRRIWNGKMRYGFSNYLWGGELGYNYFYMPKKFSRIGFKVKSIVEQYNSSEPITPLINSAYTLLMNENYMKLFKETALETSYFSEISNGIFLNGILKYAQRDPLKNNSDNLWIDDTKKLFTSNNPQNTKSDDSSFASNRALTIEVSASFRFRQKYLSRPNQKIIIGSKFPRLNISYKKALATLNALTNYDLLGAMLYDDISLGLFGKLGYRIRGGAFINNRTMYFMDNKHFLGNQTIFNTNDYLNSYRLLPYYDYSADKWYAEIHAEHHFNGFIFNKIPFIKRLTAQEVIGGHFLFNNKINQYYEINFAIENIFGLLRIDYVLGYGINNKVRSGFTIGINTRL